MRVWINDQSFELFEGAKVQDALNKYLATADKLHDRDSYQVSDNHGNLLMPDGSLSQDSKIYINIPIS
jgi:hypothetical protein